MTTTTAATIAGSTATIDSTGIQRTAFGAQHLSTRMKRRLSRSLPGFKEK
jgi:hypothetical protein